MVLVRSGRVSSWRDTFIHDYFFLLDKFQGSLNEKSDDQNEKVRTSQENLASYRHGRLPGGGARPVETITAGWKGRMVECCVFLYTGVAALRFELVLGRCCDQLLVLGS